MHLGPSRTELNAGDVAAELGREALAVRPACLRSAASLLSDPEGNHLPIVESRDDGAWSCEA
jgi:hypothetical protein